MAELRNGGMAEWQKGNRMAEWRNGNRMAEMVECWNDRMAEWREWRYGGKNGRIAEWQKWLHTYYLRYTHTHQRRRRRTLIFYNIDEFFKVILRQKYPIRRLIFFDHINKK